MFINTDRLSVTAVCMLQRKHKLWDVSELMCSFKPGCLETCWQLIISALKCVISHEYEVKVTSAGGGGGAGPPETHQGGLKPLDGYNDTYSWRQAGISTSP